MILNFVIFIIVITALYLLIIMPKLKQNADFKNFDGWLYAHRGLHDNKSKAPENSLEAFRLAVENHYGIELDVHLTKDNVPIILHDYNLQRTCGVDKKVAELTYEELKQYHLFGTEETIPTLQEALDIVGGKVPLIIELKIPFRAKRICEVVSKHLASYSGVYCMESFNPFGLMWYKKHQPKVIRGQLATDFIREKVAGNRIQYFILKHLLMNFLAKPDFIAYHHVYRRSLSFTICRKLYRVRTAAWTIKTQAELEENRNYYHYFIFEGFVPK